MKKDAPPDDPEFRRKRDRQILDAFHWLVEQGDEKAYKKWLVTALELREGTANYEQAMDAWREKISERERR